MELAHPTTQTERLAPAYLALIVGISCLLLFSLDHETTSFWKLFEPGNLVALIFYFLPTWVMTMIVYYLSVKYRSGKSHILLAALIGIPLAFTAIILFFMLGIKVVQEFMISG